ncbi:MAG: Spermidine/putrescine-binding periplasmic protein [Anaerolineae bacterium]|nr:Spermidine/putrescine-binding periplasmic protein [Anaerolineae bacterium]
MIHPKQQAPGFILLLALGLLTLGLVVTGCSAGSSQSTAPATPTPPPLADKLVLYNWVEYMPQTVLDAFAEEYGVKVDYQIYETQEEAVANIKAGNEYDVVILGNEFIPAMLADNLLAEVSRANVPNFKNISAAFRNLEYDPNNKYTVPFNWGTTGLLVRTDLVDKPVTRWADLWDERYAGKVAVWPIQGELLSIALKSLGYSVNSENPAELEAALQQLLKLRPNVIMWDNAEGTIVPALTSGQAVMADGWAYDAAVARQENKNIEYILPEEGTFLWSDNLVIPANSPRKYTAEVFINFLLRPEITAQIVEELYYANANQAAWPLIDPEIYNDPLIFPSTEDLKNAEVSLPRTLEGQKLRDETWKRFLAADQ